MDLILRKRKPNFMEALYGSKKQKFHSETEAQLNQWKQ